MRISIIRQLTAVALLLMSAPIATAADNRTEADSSWEKGIKAYADREYDQAVEEFEEVVERGFATADTYYNLANAYFKLGQTQSSASGTGFANGELGRAILNYQRALKMDPLMEDAAYNLDLAVDYTNDTESVPEGMISGVWTSLRDSFTSNTWTIVSLIALTLTLAHVLIYLLSHRVTLRKVAFFAAILLFIAFVLTTWLAISQRSSQESHDRAVVICNSTTAVHASPDSSSKIIREPSQGVTLTITRALGEWYEVMFADGEKGWIPSSYIERI